MELFQLNIGLFLSSNIETFEKVGSRIQQQMAKHGIDVDVLDIADANSKVCESYDFFIFAIPAWDYHYTQHCWEGIEPQFACSNLCGKIAAIYVMAESPKLEGYFLHAMSWLSQCVTKTGATVVNLWPSNACNRACPFAADKLAVTKADHGSIVTDHQIASWTEHLIAECSQLVSELSV
ncbi:hypothetical protein [Reinekea marinisedimentorum]|uniref:Flavodoxin n=1 Tax=Reinekea marinisedimentorum TaxID=230495 RepID=A0A4R3HY46_9GAMM|nr:hypothetical protein [Reinekea marinisedimentorum]TCS36399.1 flavodoxin [Reinekea marinisedimentorum]